MRFYYVYILASIRRVLYVGVTGNLENRLAEHRAKVDPECFTARYNVKRLVYVEEYTRIEDAIAREKQIKRWSRSKKLTLIERLNPAWEDLGAPPAQIPRLRSG